MTIAGLWRYGNRRHVATGWTAVINRNFNSDFEVSEYEKLYIVHVQKGTIHWY